MIAVSPVLDPVETLAALQRGFPGYELYFVRKWLRSLRKKQAAWPGHLRLRRRSSRLRDLKVMTAELVRRYTDFPALEDYLNGYAVTGQRLAHLEVPSNIITSLDDPIIPVSGLARLRPAGRTVGDAVALRRALRLLRTSARVRPGSSGASSRSSGANCPSARRASPRTRPPPGRWSP